MTIMWTIGLPWPLEYGAIWDIIILGPRSVSVGLVASQIDGFSALEMIGYVLLRFPWFLL